MSFSSALDRIKFMTFNVWSCEHVAVYRRIRSICDIIERHDPDVIFVQEVTEYIYSIFKKASWWSKTLAGNVVLGGDMSWDDDIDRPFPAEERSGWVVAWCALRGGGGWTYNTVANPMLREWRQPERKRPDRFLCKLRDFKLDSIEMVGVEPISGVTHCGDKGNELVNLYDLIRFTL
uniref:Endonuclease/exonuclease/phosphatase domain-containing protein n=1 Tax=Oryza punctata TaxID=4537 RepID=A0A0E0LL58_ORYPU